MFVSEDESHANTKTRQLAGAVRQATAGRCPVARALLSAGNMYLFTSGAWSLVVSKVGSFLASSEGEISAATGKVMGD